MRSFNFSEFLRALGLAAVLTSLLAVGSAFAVPPAGSGQGFLETSGSTGGGGQGS
jgi:hypothetical protein